MYTFTEAINGIMRSVFTNIYHICETFPMMFSEIKIFKYYNLQAYKYNFIQEIIFRIIFLMCI